MEGQYVLFYGIILPIKTTYTYLGDMIITILYWEILINLIFLQNLGNKFNIIINKMVLKFKDIFTEKFYPWNLIILVLILLLVVILIWGGVTNWKFINNM